ncbi:MAG: GNAT family N-acetyltransferase [Acidobacteria bacterium]|nr:GNAT family N-acetyltransferase [Acidobacteriota bacterium]MBV9476151.1 GNAT family N-acetyltransferase [Acidobacteriota bacterium]
MKIRVATASDLSAIDRVMRASMQSLGAAFYDERQLASAVAYIAQPDHHLVDDGTFYVVEDEDGTIVACGGWSARRKLFTGTDAQAATSGMLNPATDPARIRAMFVHPAAARRGLGRLILETAERAAHAAGFTRCELMATLPGVPLYRACGYEELEPTVIRLPDGVELETVRMGKGATSAGT